MRDSIIYNWLGLTIVSNNNIEQYLWALSTPVIIIKIVHEMSAAYLSFLSDLRAT